MKCTKLAGVASFLLFAAGALQAAPKADLFPDGKPLAEQIQQIDTDLNDGKTYSEIKADARTRVREALGRMRSTLERYPGQATLPAQAATEVFNDQQLVNTVLTRAREDSRLICRREKATGSNFATTQCMTVAQRERIKADAQRNMDQHQRVGNYSN